MRHSEEFGRDRIFAIRPACQIDKDRGETLALDMAPDPRQSAVTDHLDDFDPAAIQLSCGGRNISETGSGSVQDKEKALLSQIVEKLNDLFTGDLTDSDQLSYAMAVKGKLLENKTLVQQASSNMKEQFANSPVLKSALLDAIIEALEAHSEMSKQALGSEVVQEGLKDALMGPGRLYEALQEMAT